MGTVTDNERDAVIKNSRLYGKYDNVVDYESAFEKIEKNKINVKEDNKVEKSSIEKNKTTSKTTRKKKSEFEKMAGRLVNKTIDTAGRKIGNAIFKGLFK